MKTGVLPDPNECIKWLSPLKNNDYTEYRDQKFIQQLDLNLNIELDDFWPQGGPVWDGLAKTSNDKVFLVEAKAHIPEMITNKSGACLKSLNKIAKSLAKVRAFLNAKPYIDWTQVYFQYTNRLAHLYYLRELNKIDAFLLNIYFLNAKQVNGPSSELEWKGAIKLLKVHLGITRTKLTPFIKDIFVDVNAL